MDIKEEILKTLNNDPFEEWYEEYESSDNFDEYMYFDERKTEIEEELEEDNLSESEIEEAIEEERKDFAKKWFDDRFDGFIDKLEDSGNLTDDSILCARVIMYDEEFLIEHIEKNNFGNYSGIGVYWSWNHSRAEAHWGEFGKGFSKIKIMAFIKFSSIDWYRTFFANMSPSLGKEEAEINVKAGEDIKVIMVNSTEMNHLVAA